VPRPDQPFERSFVHAISVEVPQVVAQYRVHKITPSGEEKLAAGWGYLLWHISALVLEFVRSDIVARALRTRIPVVVNLRSKACT
jgi:hypothetical protein